MFASYETNLYDPRGQSLVHYFFLVYINDLPENVSCNVKLFVDHTSLFSVLKNKYEQA